MRDFQQGGRFEKGGSARSGGRSSGGRSSGGSGERSFGGSGGGRSSGGFGGRSSASPIMHQATCSDCGKGCEVPFKPSGMKPIYCRDCFRKDESPEPRRGGSYRPMRRDTGGFGGRDSGGFGGRDSGRSSFEKEMFSTTCAECGDRCEVPFKPNGEKPVFCSNCFKKENSRSVQRDPGHFDSRDFTGYGGNIPEEKPMFTATCADCGDECEVPFKPTGEKPVYCRDCFKKEDNAFKKGGNDGARNAEQYKKDFEQLNIKMDSILRRLDVLMSGQQKPGQKSEVSEDVSVAPVAEKKKKVMEKELSKKVKAPKPEVKKSKDQGNKIKKK